MNIFGVLYLASLVISASFAGFLESKLPLTVTVTTPYELLTAASVELSDAQTITVVFSRPVQALGTGFGTSTTPDQVPFTLACGVPGKFRWVTTFIARFDPSIPWPPDLQCALKWNTRLASYDGVRLQMEGLKTVNITTPPLSMTLGSVASPKAMQLTDNLWDANVGSEADKLPEVPPDGTITLSFSYPVDLKLVGAALKVYKDADGAVGQALPIGLATGVCAPAVPYSGGFSGLTSRRSKVVAPTPSANADPTCVALNFTAALQRNTYYQLCLPAGSPYYKYAGRPSQAVCTRFAGLRPFRIPLQAFSESDVVSYRRLDLWLPHGLQHGTPAASLKRAVALCKVKGAVCSAVPLSTSLPNKGTLRLTVPALQPATLYRLQIRASPGIKDGYGQPLQAASTDFNTSTIDPQLQGPVYGNQRAVLTLEAGLPANRQPSWPYVANGRKADVTSASFWGSSGQPGPQLDGLLQITSPNNGYINAGSLLGAPDGSVEAVRAHRWYSLRLNVSTTPGPWVVASCCNTVDYPTTRQVSADVVVLQTSALMASALACGEQLFLFVTSPSGPQPGLSFDLYRQPQEEGANATKVGSGTTAADGVAVVAVARSNLEYWTATAVLKPHGAPVVLLPNIQVAVTPEAGEKFHAAVVLDRKLVREGETLYVSGIIRRDAAATFELPRGTNFSLALSPNPLASAPSQAPVPYPLEVDPTFGTFTLELPIPKGARFTSYSLDLQPSIGSVAVTNAPTFIVADPRPPTVALQLTAAPWVAPKGQLAISVQTLSYLGNAVSQAPVGVSWSVGSATGVLNFTTDASGVANATLDLATLPAGQGIPPSAGDFVTLSAEWIGPTRERVTQEASVLIAEGRYTVAVARSLPTSLPGVPFFLTASVADNDAAADASAIIGGQVTASIEVPPGGPKPGCPLPRPCTLTAGSSSYSNCSLQLPCIGNFVLKACYNGSCSSLPLGKNSTEWANAPLAAFEDIVVAPDNANGSYLVGESATISCHLPRPASAVLLVVANVNNITTKVLTDVPAGLLKTVVELDQSLLGGATVQVVAHLPRSTAPAPKVPTSAIFDPNAPTSLLALTTLAVTEARQLGVEISAPQALEPGATSEVSVKVASAGGPARVTLLAVDQALLDLVPYPLPNLLDSFLLNLAASIDSATLASSMNSMAAIEAAFKAAITRLNIDPWLSPSDLMQITPSGDLLALDTPLQQYLAGITSQLSYFPSRASGSAQRHRTLSSSVPQPAYSTQTDTTTAPSAAEGGQAAGAAASNQAGDGSGASVRLEAAFRTTPLFVVLTTDAGGGGIANFTAPLNLGTFALRAFAATGASSKVGSAEAKVVVRRKVSLTPSVPRFVRSGDAFEAGVVVTVVSAEASVTVTVSVELSAASKAELLSDSTSQEVTLTGAEKQKEVRFSFKAAAQVGEIVATFSATDGAGGEDAVEASLAVAPTQEPVVLGTSFAVNASAASDWQEGLELPAAVPGSGGLELTASVAFLAAVQAAFTQITTVTPEIPEGYWAAAVAAYPAVVAQYKQPLGANASASVQQALKWVKALNAPKLGLLPYPATLGYYPQRTDIYLNTWASWLVAAYPASALDPPLAAAAPAWAEAAGRQLTDDVTTYLSANTRERWSDLELLAWVRLALGSDWEPATDDADVKRDLAWARLTANVSALGPTARSLVALTLQKERAPASNPTIQAITRQLQSALRTQGRTAYVAQDPTSASAAGMEDQALALLVLAQAGVPSPLVPKLAAYVAANKPPAPLLWCSLPAPSPRPTATAQLALATYDRLAGNLQPDLTLTAAANTTLLLTAAFNTPTAPPATSTTPWEAIPAAATAIDFRATGSGQASVAATMTFVPSRVLSFPTYRGIWIQRAYQAVAAATGDAVGAPLAQVKLASLVAVTVTVTSPDDLPDVEVRVLLPGGLEPVDPSVFTDPAAQLSCSEGQQGDSLAGLFPWWWWPVCPAQETRPQVVLFRYPHFTAGTHNIKFLAVAASVGTFQDPPARAFSQQQPELMGLTAGGVFRVCDGAACRAAEAPPPAAPKDCNGGCSDNGVCNLTAGECICDQGFSGTTCSTATP